MDAASHETARIGHGLGTESGLHTDCTRTVRGPDADCVPKMTTEKLTCKIMEAFFHHFGSEIA